MTRSRVATFERKAAIAGNLEAVGAMSAASDSPAQLRRVLGMLSLAKKYGTAAVDDACAAALEMGVHEYRFVRRYLERGPQLTLKQVDPLIRELVHYRDLIHHRTQEQEP